MFNCHISYQSLKLDAMLCCRSRGSESAVRRYLKKTAGGVPSQDPKMLQIIVHNLHCFLCLHESKNALIVSKC